MGNHALSKIEKFKNVARGDMFFPRPEDLTIIGLDTDDGPEHYLWDERAKKPVRESLVLNIISQGLIQPVVVRKDGGRLLVSAGRQRVKAAREANKRLLAAGSDPICVQAILKTGDDDDHMAMSFAENEQREDDDPMVKARKAKRYMDRGHTVQDAATVFGVTTATIRNWIAVLEAPSEVRAAVKNGRISATAAAQLGGLSAEEQKKKLTEVLSTTKPGKRATVTKVKDSVKPRGNRMRGRFEIELVIVHRPAELEALDGMTAIRWALGGLEIEELKIEEGKEGSK